MAGLSMQFLYIVNARMPTERAHGLQIAKTLEAFQKVGARVVLLVPGRRNHIKFGIKEYYSLSESIAVKKIFDPFVFLQPISEKIYFPVQRAWFLFWSVVYGLFWRGTIISRDIVISFLLSMFGKVVAYEDHEPKNWPRGIYGFFLRVIKKKIIVAKNLSSLYSQLGAQEETFVVVPNGVDLGEFAAVTPDKNIWGSEYGLPEKEKVVLYVGHFFAWKGVYTLLDAAKDIAGRVVLVGGLPQDQDKIKSYLENKKINNVKIIEFQSHDKVIKLIKSADVVVLPNTQKEERSSRFTTPLKLFEYLASGVPLVASNLPSFQDYLVDKENCLLFTPDNSESLAKNVNLILDNSSLAKNLSGKALQDAQKYTWLNRAKKIINFLAV
jgi:glycosyltransferase involved in cell wall biosynthesis